MRCRTGSCMRLPTAYQGFVVREMLLAEKVAALRRKAGSGDASSPESEGRPEGSRPPASHALGTYSLRQILTHQLGPSSRTARAEGAIGGALLGAYWTFAVSEASAFKVKVQVGVLLRPLLHAPDQSTDRPLVTLSVMLVPGAKGAEPVVPTGTLRPAGAEETASPARPVAAGVSSGPPPLAMPPPPQICGATQVPQVSVPPQPSRIVPQFLPWAAQVVGVQVQPAMGVPTHAPATHVSAEVQGLPSLH